MPQLNKIIRHIREWSYVAVLVFGERAHKLFRIFNLKVDTACLEAIRIRHTNANVFDLVVANRKRAININTCRSANSRDLAIFFDDAFHELKFIRIVGKNFNSGNIELGTGQLFAQLFCSANNMPERRIKLLFGGYGAKCVELIHTTEYIVLFENVCRAPLMDEPRNLILKSLIVACYRFK